MEKKTTWFVAKGKHFIISNSLTHAENGMESTGSKLVSL